MSFWRSWCEWMRCCCPQPLIRVLRMLPIHGEVLLLAHVRSHHINHIPCMQLVRVEAPLLSMVPVAGPQYGEVYGLGADQMVHR
eukprot:scaffold26075_cov22-Tisochrysis_lutea.AAC.1